MAEATEVRRSEDPYGVDDGFTDALGRWMATPPEIRAALRKAMGAGGSAPPRPASPPTLLALAGESLPWPEPSRLVLEDGSERALADALPEDCPLGVHRLLPIRGPGEAIRLIVHPGRCPSPPSRRAWGWSVQLYAARSAASWGIGDLADLRRLGTWSSGLGARFLMINPLGAAQPVAPVEASPYYPSTRRFLNPLYLRIEEVPGADAAAGDLAGLAERGRALNAKPLIERDEVFRLKHKALEILWARFTRDRKALDPGDDHGRFLAEAGEGLSRYGLFCAIAELHGPDWRKWPPELRHPSGPAVAAFGESRRDRAAYHAWLQWLLDVQLRGAAEALPLVQDLPIGFDPGGADAWEWQDLLASDVSVGAPPDEFNARGQNWGLPPFIPHRLREAGYAPLRETLRSVLRHAGGLRVDHVMGLFRLWWIPPGAEPDRGGYVRYPHDEILAVLATECARARAFAVGEDLGTVEPGVREAMARWGILGSKVLWFEKDPPSTFPPQTMASISTHDLPTLAGLWSGADEAEQQTLGLPVPPGSMRPVLDRLKTMAGLSVKSDGREVARRVHRLLSESASALLVASLEDALGVDVRPNLPGTTLERPNWRRALPLPLEEVETLPQAKEVATAMDRRP